MKAVRVVKPGSLDGLLVEQEQMPAIGSRDILIKVHAASLNYRDIVLAHGQYPGFTRDMPVPLSDGAGEVVEIGSDVTRFKVGDRVTVSCNTDWLDGRFIFDYHSQSIGFTLDGMLREYAVYHENAFVKLPDYLSYEEAASLPCAAVSAWSALTFGEPLTPGQTVLIQGTGGVALFGLQIARMFGARVLAITSSKEKAATLKDLGADAVVNYSQTPQWGDEILKLTNGHGVDKVIEIGGEKTIQQSINCSRYGGEIGLVGFVSGTGGGLPPIEILKKSIIIKGIAIGPRLSFESLLAGMEVFKVKPVIDSVFPFQDYQSAFRKLEAGQHVGKIIIKVSE